jgi:hypothetical protein
MSRTATVPVSCSSLSARVDFPWAMWAMMQKLRILETGTSVMATILRSHASAASLVHLG